MLIESEYSWFSAKTILVVSKKKLYLVEHLKYFILKLRINKSTKIF